MCNLSQTELEYYKSFTYQITWQLIDFNQEEANLFNISMKQHNESVQCNKTNKKTYQLLTLPPINQAQSVQMLWYGIN